MRAFPSLFFFLYVKTEPEVRFPCSRNGYSLPLVSSSLNVRAYEIKDQICEGILPPHGRERKSVSLPGKHRSKSGFRCSPRKLTLRREDNRYVPLIVYLGTSRLLRVAILMPSVCSNVFKNSNPLHERRNLACVRF